MAGATGARSHSSPLSTGEAAAALGVHERTLRRYISLGRIRRHRLPGGHYRISPEAIEDFWRENDADSSSRRGVSAQPPAAPRSHTPPATYDLSPQRLEAIRAQYR
jgi:excisionase family DNA binding protein